MWTYMMAAARGDRAMSMINARRNENRSAAESPSRLSRPLFPHSHHRLPRVGNGPSNINHPFGGQGYLSYASTSYPLPEYTTSNPNRCPHNSNDILGQYASTTTNHVDLSNNRRTTSGVGMKDERISETVIEDGQNDQL
ncbi:hypothetical protein Bhyg_09584 [Pseudolycoriella hygida]|uniref:Uncharacterized protein n=1 Tax=Pseudolycoriella hygida TaxID=35572 RepID=A0A9Q0N6Y9_9DIPT|nr:hypothetical protein Bhyg_09584 [Pseudolycoriella hygida]